MYVVTSPSEKPAASRPRAPVAVHGVGRVAYAVDGQGVTRLKDLYQHDPVRLLFPTPPAGEIATAVFVTTSGGLVGGDRLTLSATAHGGAALLATPQAAEKVYRSNGRDCLIDVSLTVEEGGWLEWLPQETILFDGARLRRKTAANVAGGARLLAGEFLVLGRQAMGESVTHGLVQDDWTVRRDGRLVWEDALRLDGDIAALVAHPAGLDGARAVATAIHVADDAAAHLETARDLLARTAGEVRAGASVVNGVLLARFMGADPYPVRQAFGEFWASFRQAAGGRAPVLPRLWHI